MGGPFDLMTYYVNIKSNTSIIPPYIGTKIKYGGNQPRHPHHNRRLFKKKVKVFG